MLVSFFLGRRCPPSPLQFIFNPYRLHLLKHDDGHCVIQDTLSKDDRVQLGVDFELVEDGENSDWIGGRQDGAKDHRVQET